MTSRAVLTLAAVCFLAGSAVVVAAGGPAVAAPDRPTGSDASLPSADGPHPTGGVDGQSPRLSGLQGPPETDATVTRVRVLSNGTAVWALTIRMQLDSDEAETEFAAFEEEFRANRSSYVESYRDRMTGVVADAGSVTGREMSATGFEAEVGTEAVPRQWGYVTYRFRWTGFAPVQDDTVPVGDVFEGGLFLEENDIFVIAGPEGYESTAVRPDPDEATGGELRWEGPASFADGRPAAEFVAASTDDSTADGSADGDPADGSSDGGTLWPGAAALGVLAALAVAGLYVRRRRRPADADAEPARAADSSGAESAPAEMPDLATDEDRVIAALEEADGRMRQSDLADRLDWSPSKTSRVLSDMADEGRVEKLRIGRENVIDLVRED